MVWLNLTDEKGSSLYLDIRGIEPRGRKGEAVYAITGVLGDGLFETEVLVEVGAQVEVTFIGDALSCWRQPELLRQVDGEALAAALAETVAGLAFCLESFPSLEGRPRQRVTGYRTGGHWLKLRPHQYEEQLELPLTVAAPAGSWRAVA